MSTRSTTSPSTLELRAKAHRALVMRRDTAATWETIAKECNYSSAATAQRAVARLANRIEAQDVDSYRAMFDEQLAFLWDQCQDRILTSDRNAMGFATLLQSGVRIIDRRAKLHGVDAPLQVDASVRVVSQFDEEIQTLVDAFQTAGTADRVDLVKHPERVDA